MSKRKDLCQKGKSCGSTCISRLKRCLIELGENLSESLEKVRKGISGRVREFASKVKDVVRNGPARRKANKFDKEFSASPKLITLTGDGRFNWGNHTSNSKFGGSGAYGTVVVGGDVVVKRGTITLSEPINMGRVAQVGAAPRVIQSEVINQALKGSSLTGGNVEVLGRVAMQKAPGIPFTRVDQSRDLKLRQEASSSFWAMMKKIHKLGIAHGDMHTGNVFYDPSTKKSMAIDFGLSSRGYAKALKEALAPIFELKEQGGDDRYSRNALYFGPSHGFTNDLSKMNPNLRKMYENLPAVEELLRSKGLRNADLYRGRYGGLGVNTLKKAINLLYDGVR